MTTDQGLIDAAFAALEALEESRAEVEALMARDQSGWVAIGDGTGLSREVRVRKTAEAVMAAAADPLIKRGLAIRAGYIWADGVQVTVRDDPETGKDVPKVIADFWDDPANAGFCRMSGNLDIEHRLGTAGEVWLALPTTPAGRVRVRKLPPGEISQVFTDPEDIETDWFYLRAWQIDGKQERVLYPALGYLPAVQPAVMDHAIYPQKIFRDLMGVPIRWDSPVRKILVNAVAGRGLGDAFASIPWADAYSKFLNSWYRLMLSLARFAWQAKSGRADKAAEIAKRVTDAAVAGITGAVAVTSPGEKLEAIGKSGATFDADSGKQIAGMVAAGLGVPVTMLLTDPGVSGARAVAETLDPPTKNEFKVRRGLHSEVFRDVTGWVIDSAVRAGKLAGTITRDGDRETVTLPEDDSRDVVVTWPDFDSDDTSTAVEAVVKAHATGTIPDTVVAQLLLGMLGVEDIDSVLKQITDSDGNYLPPDVRDARTRARYEDRDGVE